MTKAPAIEAVFRTGDEPKIFMQQSPETPLPDNVNADPLAEGGQVFAVDGTTQRITNFDPSKDRVDLGTGSIHVQIPVDTSDGLVFQNMFNPNSSLTLVGVNLKDLTAGNFTPISDAHLQQDLSAAMAWENGTGNVRENTVYIRSHEEALQEVVEFNPATDKISFFYLSVRGDNQVNFSVEQTEQGVRFYSPITKQSITLKGTTFADLNSSHFEWRANQLEDNIAGRMGLSDQIDNFSIVNENVFSGKSVAMAGLVDRAPYHSNPDYTGTQIGSNPTPVDPTPVDPTPTPISTPTPDPIAGLPSTAVLDIDKTYTGRGTYYGATGAGNAGYDVVPVEKRDMLTALNYEQWDNSEGSGAFFEVSGPYQQNGNADPITVMVVDQLPDRGDGLDLSPEAFAKVGNTTDGIIDLNYKLVSPSDDFVTPYGHKIGDGIIVDRLAESNPYWAAVRLTNHRNPVEGIDLLTDGGERVALERKSNNIFVLEQGIGGPLLGAHDFVATDIFGQEAMLNDIDITSGTGADVMSGNQFGKIG